MCRMIGLALGAVVSLSQQPGVTWAAADQAPVTAADSSTLTRTSPAELATESPLMLSGRGARSNSQLPRSSLTMDKRPAAVPRGWTPSAPREGDPVIWQHPIPTAIPLSSALILRDLESEPAGRSPTPTATQILDDADLTIVAGVQFRF